MNLKENLNIPLRQSHIMRFYIFMTAICFCVTFTTDNKFRCLGTYLWCQCSIRIVGKHRHQYVYVIMAAVETWSYLRT